MESCTGGLWLLVKFLTFLMVVNCEGPVYRKYISPFSIISEPVFETRDIFPFSSPLEQLFQIALTRTERQPDLIEEPEFKLKLNRNRFAFTKVGYTCGVPGNGIIDPFELGPKFVAPPRSILARLTRTGKFKAEEKDDPASLLPAEARAVRFPRAIDTVTERVVGDLVEPNVLCWQVKLRFDLGNGTSKLCGGSIIGSRTILTAAHCLIDSRKAKPFHPSLVTVQVGQDGEQCAEIFPADLLIPHSGYDTKLEDNDIGVIILAREIDFLAKPCACKLCVKDMQPSVGDVCIVYGYGQNVESEISNAQELRWHKQLVLTQTFDSRCAFHIGGGKITDLDKFICAGDLFFDTSCQGDEGSSFVCFDRRSSSHYAAGVIAFSAGCGKRIGSQYAKVQAYLDWIEANTPSQNVRVQRGWNREIARNL